MSAPDDPMTDDQAADALLDAIAEMRRDPYTELVDRLRALIEQWRSTAGVLSVHYDATGEGELRGRSKVYQIAADELERAIGGGRG